MYALTQGLQPISAGVDVAYEAGRRIGVIQGMDTLIKAMNEFEADKDAKDGDL